MPLGFQRKFMEDELAAPRPSEELVLWLEMLYPDKIVTAELSPYEQGKQHGIIEIVRYLRALHEYNEEED